MSGLPQNNVKWIRFTKWAFQQEVRRLSDGGEGWEVNAQTRYLSEYLERLGALTLVIEHHYVDRHFSEEYSAYHARDLVQRPNACARIHAFTEKWRDKDWVEMCTSVLGAGEGGAGSYERLDEIQRRLSEAYLGFVVVRPVPFAPIGRTALRAPGDPDGYIGAVVTYPVHLLGFELEVRGALGFQQQDGAVGTCATTAVWSALQRVRRRDGARCPSPSEITEAAVRHVLEGRTYPSTGLSVLQISEAFRAFDFPPDVLQAQPDPALFWILLNTYLRSRIPVVLALPSLDDDPTGHAVTAIGYRKTAAPLFSHRLASGVTVVNAAFDQLYLHDDQLGPYVSAPIGFDTFDTEDGPQTYPAITIPAKGSDAWPAVTALAPLYPKHRSNARGLWTSALRLLEAVKDHIAEADDEVGLEFFFTRSGRYQQRMFEKGLDPSRVFKFQRVATLSRYIGVSRYYVQGEACIDAIWDATDTVHEEAPYNEHLIGLVARRPQETYFVDFLADHHPGLNVC